MHQPNSNGHNETEATNGAPTDTERNHNLHNATTHNDSEKSTVEAEYAAAMEAISREVNRIRQWHKHEGHTAQRDAQTALEKLNPNQAIYLTGHGLAHHQAAANLIHIQDIIRQHTPPPEPPF